MASTISTCTAPHSATLTGLISQVRAVVRREEGDSRIGAAVADLLRPCLLCDDLLNAEQMVPDEECYRQHILHVEPDGSFSVVSLVWLPGQETCIHDHVSWCVVGVYRGQEHEIVYSKAGDDSDPHLAVAGNVINPAGAVAALVPPGDIHRVENAGQELAVSMHIYGADIAKLGSSIRRRYHLDVREPAGV